MGQGVVPLGGESYDFPSKISEFKSKPTIDILSSEP